MAQKHGSIRLAWKSPSGKKLACALMLVVFLLCLSIGSSLRYLEQTTRTESLLHFSKTLASTTLSAGGEAEDILLKVNDLLNVDAVLGVRLMAGNTAPLSVGDTDLTFPATMPASLSVSRLSDDGRTMDVAFKLDDALPFDLLVMRLDGESLMPAPVMGSLINWVGAPLVTLLVGLVCLWMTGVYMLRPLQELRSYFDENNKSFASTPLAPELLKGKTEASLLAKQVENLRSEILHAKDKAEFQARFLQETPYPLLRCSVNRKVMYANAAAKSHAPLFGDDSKEFVSPSVSELIRKSFQDAKQIYGDVRSGDTIITFRAIPVLDTGYVNLYGEVSRKIDEDI